MINLELPEGFSIKEEEDFVFLFYKEEIASFSAYLEHPQIITDVAEAYLREVRK
jgi:hypothetical protein